MTCPLGGGRSIQLSYVDGGRMLPQHYGSMKSHLLVHFRFDPDFGFIEQERYVDDDRATAYGAVFNVFLCAGAGVQQQVDGFPAVGALHADFGLKVHGVLPVLVVPLGRLIANGWIG